MGKTFRFILENAKNLGFLFGVATAVVAFIFTLYGLPIRLEKAESTIDELKSRSDRIEMRLSIMETSFTDLKEDIKDIKSDVKLLLRTK